jgi:hypothetical protein
MWKRTIFPKISYSSYNKESHKIILYIGNSVKDNPIHEWVYTNEGDECGFSRTRIRTDLHEWVMRGMLWD